MKGILVFLFTINYLSVIFGQNLEYSREIVKKLSSPEFKGRGYVEDGNKIAAEYIQVEFEKLGLSSFSKNYYQKFNIEVNTFPSEMLLEFDGLLLDPGKDYIIDPLSNSLKGTYNVIKIKKEDLLDDNKLRDAIKKSFGQILLIDETDVEIENKEQKKKAEEIINFLKYSPNISTAGIIIYTNNKLTWSTSSFQASKPSFIVNKKIDLSKLGKVSINVNADLIKYKTQNIVGFIEGSVYPDSFLVVTAHYDHLGKMGKDTYFPGANDNASGIAILMNIAKYYKANPNKYTVVCIALSAEEIGLQGAKYFVDNPLIDLEKIKFLVNFDLAGTGDEGIKVVNGSIYQDKFDLLKRLNAEKKYLESVQIRGAACNSDHCMFYEKGVPCFYIYTLGGIKAYHDIFDKNETLPLNEIVDYSKLMIDFFNEL